MNIDDKRFGKYHLCESADMVTESVPGKNSKELLRIQNEIESNNVSYPKGIPLAFEFAKGAIVQDVDGNRYLDFFAEAGVLNLGHNNIDILEDLKKLDGVILNCLDFPTKIKISFMKDLLTILPKAMQNECKISFGGPTGSDAIEAALKLARINTGRHGIIAFHGSYHGMTMGALSVTSTLSHREKVAPLIPGVHFLPYGSCYRCFLDRNPKSCKMNCVQYFKQVLENPHSGVDKPAAIIVEPVQGEGGTYIPPRGWLESITDIARKNGLLVIFDEIQAGFYRTGKAFSFEHTGAIPDIITVSKGIGGIGLPLSLLVYRKDLDTWAPGTHIGTFRGNQMAMAAGSSAIKFVRRHNLASHVRKIGKLILDELVNIQKETNFIGEVRGIGMMFGIEYVKDKNSKEPFTELAKTIRRLCYENGLLVEIGGHYDNVVRFLPPLIITQKIAENALGIFKKAHRLAKI